MFTEHTDVCASMCKTESSLLNCCKRKGSVGKQNTRIKKRDLGGRLNFWVIHCPHKQRWSN